MLRPLDKADLELVLSWRNNPVVRQAMCSQHEITREEHHLWFQRMQKDERKQWFLFLDHDGKPCAVVNFVSIDKVQRTAFWGFYADPNARPGTGMRMSLEALDKAYIDLGLRKLSAEVLASNLRSLEMHKKVGFIKEGHFRDHFFDGERYVDVVRFAIFDKEWLLARRNLLDLINQWTTSSRDIGVN